MHEFNTFTSDLVLDAPPKQKLFLEVVASAIPWKWKEFGAMVGLKENFFKCLPQQESSDQNWCKIRFLDVFFEWEKSDVISFTWGTVISTLRSEYISADKVADKLERELSTASTVLE